MADVYYIAMLAVDLTTGLPRPELKNQSGQIVTRGTTTTVAITDWNGLTIADSRLTITDNCFVPSFKVADLSEVDWWDGTNRVPLESNYGTLLAAQAAQAAATAAATAAASAALAASGSQTAAEAAASSAASASATATSVAAAAVKTVNGVSPDGSGNVTVATGGGGGTGGAVDSVNGRTGAVSLTKSDVGLALVDNTSDASKPISTPQAAGLAAKTHTHATSDVTGLDAALASKAGVNDPVNASQVNAGTGVIAPSHLGSGTPTSSLFLRGDGAWATPTGGGGSGAVNSVNGKTGDVTLTATDVSALPSSTPYVASVAGRTGTVTLAKGDVGLGNVDNTSDASKPLSTAATAALAAKATDSAVVHNTGAETVAGVKTFSDKPVVPDASFTIAKTSGLQSALDAKAAASAVVPIVQVTAAQYAALTPPVSGTLYLVIG